MVEMEKHNSFLYYPEPDKVLSHGIGFAHKFCSHSLNEGDFIFLSKR